MLTIKKSFSMKYCFALFMPKRGGRLSRFSNSLFPCNCPELAALRCILRGTLPGSWGHADKKETRKRMYIKHYFSNNVNPPWNECGRKNIELEILMVRGTMAYVQAASGMHHIYPGLGTPQNHRKLCIYRQF
jgi:hypothetical protein